MWIMISFFLFALLGSIIRERQMECIRDVRFWISLVCLITIVSLAL